ncbi:MAG: hypothetical protein QM762_06595 [Chryseolinea sp.]
MSTVGKIERAVRAHGFVAGDQLGDHLLRFGHAFGFGDRRQLGELPCKNPVPDSPGNGCVQRSGPLPVPQLRCTGLHEHQVQGVEHRTGHVPVEVVGLQIQRVGVGQQLGQAVGDLFTVLAR